MTIASPSFVDPPEFPGASSGPEVKGPASTQGGSTRETQPGGRPDQVPARPFDADEWNPVYLAYCEAQGESDPEAMLARDEARYPGGRMAGFILWLSGQARA